MAPKPVRWAFAARADLLEALEYIVEESPQAASDLLRQVEEAASSLGTFSGRGVRVREVIADDLRQMGSSLLAEVRKRSRVEGRADLSPIAQRRFELLGRRAGRRARHGAPASQRAGERGPFEPLSGRIRSEVKP